MNKKALVLAVAIVSLAAGFFILPVNNTNAQNSTVYTRVIPEAFSINLTPELSSGVTIKKGDKLKFDIVVGNPGDFSGTVTADLFDIPPGIKATLKMNSNYMAAGQDIKGTVELEAVGRVPSEKNRFIITAVSPGYTFCPSGDAECMSMVASKFSKTFYISGVDSNYGNSSMPAVINSVEPSILKRVKLFISDLRRENPGFSLMDVIHGNNPFIAADEMIGIYCKGQENCQPGDVDYEQWYTTKIDLADPLNPKKAERGAMINQSDRIFGHGVRPTSLGMSRNENLSFITWLRGDIYMSSKNPYIAKTLISDPMGDKEINPSGDFVIADSSSNTFLIRSIYSNDPGNRFEKVSDFQMRETAVKPANPNPGIDYRDFVPAPIPENVPQIADYGTPTAVIRALDGESSDYIAVLGNGGKNTAQIASGGGINYKLSNLSIYSLERKSALGVAKLSGLENLDANSAIISGFETPSGKYAFAAVRGKAPSSPLAEYMRVMYDSKRNFYLYKLDETGRKLDPIINNGLISEGGQIKSVAPIHVSGKDFLAVFVNAPDSSVSSGRAVKVLIYSFDDLRAGRIRNIASASISSMKQILRATSLIKDAETYMYTIDDQGAFLIWKFDKNSFSGSGVVVQPPTDDGTPVTPPPGGGVTPPPTYDCNFDLIFTPTNLTVKAGTYFASYTIKANSTSVNPFCTISIVPPSQSNIKPFLNSMVVSPGGQASMLLNVSKVSKGIYDLPVKASSRGASAKAYTVKLTVE